MTRSSEKLHGAQPTPRRIIDNRFLLGAIGTLVLLAIVLAALA